MLSPDQVTDATWTAVAPYLKAGLGLLVAWAIGKAQEKGGPIVWVFGRKGGK